MPLEIKTLTDSDYENILCGWWKDWNWEAPPKKFLPDNGKGGLIIYDGDTPVCAGFMYATNSAVAWVDWIISNKNYRKKPNRSEALRLLVESLTSICKSTGHEYVYALIKHSSLLQTYRDVGYVDGDTYNKEMIKTF